MRAPGHTLNGSGEEFVPAAELTKRKVFSLIYPNVQRLIDEADDPIGTVEEKIRDISELIEDLNAEAEYAEAFLIQKIAETRELREEIEMWDKRAHLAAQEGKDELALIALRKKG